MHSCYIFDSFGYVFICLIFQSLIFSVFYWEPCLSVKKDPKMCDSTWRIDIYLVIQLVFNLFSSNRYGKAAVECCIGFLARLRVFSAIVSTNALNQQAGVLCLFLQCISPSLCIGWLVLDFLPSNGSHCRNVLAHGCIEELLQGKISMRMG